MLMYDLVIIGNTVEAFFAASQAIKFKARVALVLGNINNNYWQEIDTLILNYLTSLSYRYSNFTQYNLKNKPILNLENDQLKQWKNQVKLLFLRSRFQTV